MKVNFELHVGEPGTGKSYTLNNILSHHFDNSLDDIAVVVPTHSAKSNLIQGLDVSNQSLKNDLIRRIYVKYLPEGVDSCSVLLIDEISMISTIDLHAILDQLNQQTMPLNIVMFGDIHQLPVQYSLFENIIQNNVRTSNVFEWALDNPYTSSIWDNLIMPNTFLFDRYEIADIKVHKHLRNYRFENIGIAYKGYSDDEFMCELINQSKVIEHDGMMSQSDRELVANDYLQLTINEILKLTPIISPTREINRAIDETMKSYCDNNGMDYKQHALFIRHKDSKPTDIFLNPNHVDIGTLKTNISGLKVGKIQKGDEFINAVTTHAFQGQTVESIAYYMGNSELPIANKRVIGHYSYNNFFTAISRSKHHIQLIGDRELFTSMARINPRTFDTPKKSDALGIYTVLRVIDDLRTQKLPNIRYTPQALYVVYMRRFDDLQSQATNPVILSRTRFFDYFIDYEPLDGIDYKYLVSENRKEQTSTIATMGGKASRGRGKIQQYIDSLDDRELEHLRYDLANRKLKPKGFEHKYLYTKRQVRDYFKKQKMVENTDTPIIRT